MSAHILTDDTRTEFQPNDTVSGTVQWSGSQPPASARLQLFYFTEGTGDRDLVVHATETFATPLTNDSRSFKFELPSAPWSFHGKHVSLHWALELLLDRPPRDELARLELIVSPTCQEIDLYDHIDRPQKQSAWQEFWQRFTG